MIKNKFIIHGIIASLALSSIYFAIVSIAQGFPHALEEFASIWYLMVPLIAGFGAQVGLFSYTHHSLKSLSSKGVAASGGVSTVSMIACCAHHITDILPLIGFTAFALFLTQYQNFFVILGILSNLIGIFFILGIIQSNRLYRKKSFFSGLFAYNMKKFRNALVVISVPILIISFLFMTMPATQAPQSSSQLVLPEKTNSGNGLTIIAKPLNFTLSVPVKFDIKFDTHQGSLDFDVAKVSVLEDSNGITYNAVSWDGSAPGSHHMEGILTFPKVSGNPSSIKLIIKNVYDVQERVFSWDLV
ncbi:MAG: hypothetical protein WC613_03660 [Candidatus Aenigmatarchaeota archaeon]